MRDIQSAVGRVDVQKGHLQFGWPSPTSGTTVHRHVERVNATSLRGGLTVPCRVAGNRDGAVLCTLGGDTASAVELVRAGVNTDDLFSGVADALRDGVDLFSPTDRRG